MDCMEEWPAKSTIQLGSVPTIFLTHVPNIYHQIPQFCTAYISLFRRRFWQGKRTSRRKPDHSCQLPWPWKMSSILVEMFTMILCRGVAMETLLSRIMLCTNHPQNLICHRNWNRASGRENACSRRAMTVYNNVRGNNNFNNWFSSEWSQSSLKLVWNQVS